MAYQVIADLLRAGGELLLAVAPILLGGPLSKALQAGGHLLIAIGKLVETL